MMSKSKREQHEDDLRELQEKNDKRRVAHKPAEVHVEVPALTPAGEEKGKDTEVHCFGGRCYVNTHGEAVFDQDGLITFIQQLQAAYQAVQV